jgi:hypothetical protein
MCAVVNVAADVVRTCCMGMIAEQLVLQAFAGPANSLLDSQNSEFFNVDLQVSRLHC